MLENAVLYESQAENKQCYFVACKHIKAKMCRKNLKKILKEALKKAGVSMKIFLKFKIDNGAQ